MPDNGTGFLCKLGCSVCRVIVIYINHCVGKRLMKITDNFLYGLFLIIARN